MIRLVDRIVGCVALFGAAMQAPNLPSTGWPGLAGMALLAAFGLGIVFGNYWAFTLVSLWFVLSLIGLLFLLPFDATWGLVGWIYVLLYVAMGSWSLFRWVTEKSRRKEG